MDLAAQRLLAQQLAKPAFRRPEEVVAWLGAMQAQDYRASLWAVGARLPGCAEAEVERAIAERAIVRTWPMRGTLHLVAAKDVRWMLALLAPRVIASLAGRHRQLELDERTFAKSRELIGRALEGGKCLTRDELYELFEAKRISTAGQRGIHILNRLAHEGLICPGANRGKQQTFVLLDEWVPAAKPMEREAALGELARRYFTGHGPATLADLAWWAGISLGDAREAVALAVGAPKMEEAGGGRYWLSSDASGPASAKSALLLPAFDELLLGYRDRRAVLPEKHAAKIQNGGMIQAIAVVDGQVVGTWRRTLRKGGVAVELEPFERIKPTAKRGLEEAAQRYAEFLRMPLLSLSPES